MYFKDYLLFIVKECVTTLIQSSYSLIQSKNKNSLYSFDVATKEYEKNGNLLSNLKINIPIEIQEKVKQVVIVFDAYVFDVGEENEDTNKVNTDNENTKNENINNKNTNNEKNDKNKKNKNYIFPSLQKYPFPLYELQNTISKFSIHILCNEEINLDTNIGLEMQIHTPNDLKVISKIPDNWTLSIEPSWNESKLKLEKNYNSIQICESPGWIPFQIYYDFFKKHENDEENENDLHEFHDLQDLHNLHELHELHNSDSDAENSNDSLKSKESSSALETFRLGLMNNNELSNDLQTQKYLGIYPLNENERMHLYFQWKSLRTIINEKISECT